MASQTASNAAAVTFPKCTGSTSTVTHFGIGTASSGAGKLLFRKALASNLAISNNIQPQFAIGQLTVTTSGDIADTFQNAILALLFNNTTFAGVGDVTGIVGSGAAGSLYISLHTSDPGAAGDQTTNESGYTSYARVAVARTSGGWTIA